MTIHDVIAKVDELMPNQYSTEQKIAWLSTLDGKITQDIILTHEGFWASYYPPEGYETDDEDLVVPPPYAEDLYCYYLESRIAEQNNEIAKYGQFSTLFNTAYTDYANWYNRTHKPRTFGRWRM